MAKLVLPSVKYKKSFLQDYLPHTEMQDEYELTGIAKNRVSLEFTKFIKNLKAQSRGVYPRKGMVPQTVFWLVNGNKFLGKLSIRHYLNHHLRTVGGHIGYYIRADERGKGYGKLILKLGLKKAETLGIKNVVISCDITNLGSKKIIEANGGKLAAKVNMPKGFPKKLRYKIRLNIEAI